MRFPLLKTLIALVLMIPSAHAQDASARVSVVSIGSQGQPTVARCDADGVIHVIADAPDGPWYYRSTDGGATFSPPLAVVKNETRKPGMVYTTFDMVVGQAGRVHVAMSSNAWKLKIPKDEWGFFFATYEPDAAAFSPIRNITGRPCEGFSLAADDRGNVSATWLADKLYVNVSRDNGQTFSANRELDPAYDPCNCCTTSAAYAADGRLAVLYREETNNDRDMYLVLWNQQQNQRTRQRVSATPWKIDACPMTYYTVTPRANGFTVVWPTKKDIYFARLDAQGRVLSPGEIKTPGTTGMRTGMIALDASDGATLVAWKNDNQLGWQLYDKLGRPQGAPGRVASPGSGCAAVVDESGRFVLVK